MSDHLAEGRAGIGGSRPFKPFPTCPPPPRSLLCLPFPASSLYDRRMTIVVEALANHPAALATAAEWHFNEWGHTDPGGSLEGWTAGLARQAGADQIPGTLIALEDRTPVGVVCLVAQDMPGYEAATGLTPWLKGLYVARQTRRRGVGSLLVRRCEDWAASLGHEFLYLYTERDSGAQALYESLSWRTIHAGRYDGIAVTVMRTALRGHGDLSALAVGGEPGTESPARSEKRKKFFRGGGCSQPWIWVPSAATWSGPCAAAGLVDRLVPGPVRLRVVGLKARTELQGRFLPPAKRHCPSQRPATAGRPWSPALSHLARWRSVR
jgi:GNAT superfamily N-acetyltransferase